MRIFHSSRTARSGWLPDGSPCLRSRSTEDAGVNHRCLSCDPAPVVGAPQRRGQAGEDALLEIEAAELSGRDPASFGLDPPRLSVKLYGGGGQPVLTARFGEFNPEGYLQYMRIDGNPRLYLMSRFVGGEWSEAMTEAAAR